MRILALVADAFGGRGGIAQFGRDMLSALCAHPACSEVVALPRVMAEEPTGLPARLTFRRAAARGKVAFVREAFRAAGDGSYDAVVCGHLHLLPLAALAARRQRAPLVLVIYGIDAWEEGAGRFARWLLRRVDMVISISEYTRSRFVSWSGVPPDRIRVLPCCIDLSRYTPGPPRDELVARYALAGRTVLLTVARLAGRERHKGFDEVLEVLPALSVDCPSLTYVIAGEGPDRGRLEARAAALGVGERVVFTGYVSEDEKIDLYRLADLFVMPGRREGFGIVYLEALACGTPVVASRVDASREAVRDGLLGAVVDPGDSAELLATVRRLLAQRERSVPQGIDYFSVSRFRERWHALVDDVIVSHAAHGAGTASPMPTAEDLSASPCPERI